MLRRPKNSHTARSCGFLKRLRGRVSCEYRMVAFFAAILLLPSTTFAAADAQRINQVKAAFILNIARFVAWPPEALDQQSNRLLLCLYRSNPFGEAIEGIAGEQVSGRRLEIAAVRNLAESVACNILLIAADELKSYVEDPQPEASRPILVIADRTGEEAHKEPLGAVIVSLVRNGSRIGFEINLDRSRQAGLKMSSKLLKLATIVDGS